MSKSLDIISPLFLSNATVTFNKIILLNSPSDQFDVLVIFQIFFGSIDLSVNNFLVMNLLLIFGLMSLGYLDKNNNNIDFFYSKEFRRLIEIALEVTSQLITDIIVDKNRKIYFPVIFVLFIFIFLNNVVGLVPYSFTSTSHICVTLFLSLTVFIGINILLIEKHQSESFSLFIPANSDIRLALLLVPIEFVSYLVRPVSLGVRLFVNLMSGHTLMKVIIGFSWSMLLLRSSVSLFLIVPMIILAVLFLLEFSVALIQTYVFVVLSCIYIQDIS